MVELVEPIFILEDAAEHSLVVAEENKGDKTAACNADLEALASTEP